MTTVMLIAAMVPIAIGQGPGSGARASMAKIIIGGQALSLLLALLVTPVTYSLFDDLRNWSKRVWRRIFGTEGTAMSLQPMAVLRLKIKAPLDVDCVQVLAAIAVQFTSNLLCHSVLTASLRLDQQLHP